MTDKSQNAEILFKILLLGDWSVGKTCFLMRYTENTFNDIHLSTIGIDYKFKSLTLEDGQKLKIQIWDTAGQERYKSITKSYIKGANGIILIYDVTSKKSFEGIQNWVKQLKELPSRICIAIAANKIDKDNRVISTDEGTKFSKEIGYPFFETSAKDGTNIDECFDSLIKQIYNNYINSPVNDDNIKISNNNKNNESKGCC